MMTNLNLTAWTGYSSVRGGEMCKLKPELVFLALSLTSFYRKSFSFRSQGPLVFLSLTSYLCVRLHSPPLTLSLALVPLIFSLASRRGCQQY